MPRDRATMKCLITYLFFLPSIISLHTAADYPFRNTSLPWQVRVDDLVKRLTVQEIMEQMAYGGAGILGGPAPGIARLGIDKYQWNSECLSGDVEAGNATSFPQAIGLAASFSTDLIHRIAEATSIELRAKHSDFVRKKIYSDHTGLSCFSPVINIMRHPLWGRNQETYGEDPFLSGVYAEHFVKGLQGDNPRYIRANAGCKHFDAHGGPENIPVSSLSFDAKVAERDLRLTFLPAFKKCIKAGTYSVMCSYNSLNGIPACANSRLLTEVLRKEWNFTGYVVSDEGAIEFSLTKHKYFTDPVDVVAASVNAGCNLELSGNISKPYYLYMTQAINAKKLTEAIIRSRVKPLFYTRMRLGEFDPPEMVPFTKYNMTEIQSEAHRKLSLEAAVKSFVLLKSEPLFSLPLKVGKNIAVIGPMANNTEQLFGDYSADADPLFIKTPLQGIKNMYHGYNISYTPGCMDGNKCQKYDKNSVKHVLDGTNGIVFVFLGTGKLLESENKDRKDMELPGEQLQLLKDTVKYGNRPVILFLFTAGPVNITWADESKYIIAIFQCFFPAQSAGDAIKQIIAQPFLVAGRLPYTWLKYSDQIPSMTLYTMNGRTYRYFTGEPLYPFGYGLSLSKFLYKPIKFPKTIKAGEPISLTVTVKNTGPYPGDEVIQIYLSWLDTKEKMPKIQLVRFNRVTLSNQEEKSFNFTIGPDSMTVWSDQHGFIIEPGRIKLYVGGQQPNQKRNVGSNIVEGEIIIKKAF
ncbi:hypothetical protein KUTeg_006816 [Tegillarca granosa]|uniref:Fibronectin type III-like domain-containing protein n=1 Tax=Tegillarca granosa TaxID=220873 RepID=A0ABQ9FEL9_TEGGR|nr:hypothetical protein KUTeg_006816 [Tegillarca granosa]